MNKEPTIGHSIDNEEEALIKAIEGGEYDTGRSLLTPSRLKELRQMAKDTLNEQRQKISLRIPKSDLTRLKAEAMREGIPYHTYQFYYS
jgi:predicted DNA binding CopG/RHH family protein